MWVINLSVVDYLGLQSELCRILSTRIDRQLKNTKRTSVKMPKLGYDKSPQYDEEWFRQEYMKVKPMINVLSNPEGRRKTEEDIKKEACSKQ